MKKGGEVFMTVINLPPGQRHDTGVHERNFRVESRDLVHWTANTADQMIRVMA